MGARIDYLTVYFLLFSLTLTMIYLKKVLFFEDMTEKTKRNVKRLLIIQILLGGVDVLWRLIFSGNDNYIVLFLTLFLMWFVNTYSSFVSRRERKWFSFFIWMPLAIFSISMYNLSRVVFSIVKLIFGKLVLANWLLCLLFSFFVGLVCVLRKIEGSFMWKLEKYGEGKSLTKKEDWFVCLASIVLGSAIYISSYYEQDMVISIAVMLYSFILAIIILFAIYSTNGRWYFEKQSHKLQRILIATMADLVENRDENTGGHIRRTGKYVEVIGKQLRAEKKFPDILTKSYLENMIIAAPLHDIGKIHVPDAILGKPARLSPEEFEIMKTHTTAGYRIIRHVEKQSKEIEYIKLAKQMAKSHHEWMNGCGYPEQLTGDEIPLCAKILAVADVFDALVSKRCYKEPLPLEKAYEIMESERGTHFDSDVLDAFFAAREEIEAVLCEDNLLQAQLIDSPR